MKRMFVPIAIATLLVAGGATAQLMPAEPEIRKLLVERLGENPRGAGIVVGTIDPEGRRIVTYGPREIDGYSIFEIGSVTKVFTSLLLAEAAARDEVRLDDQIVKYLPDETTVPSRIGRITLRELANHTSGLPRLPSNLAPADMRNPYAGYTTAQLYEYLQTADPAPNPFLRYDYSNPGAALLGDILARHAGTDYETLVRKRIVEPLGLKSTAIRLTPEMRKRFVTGHDDKGEPVPNWDLPAFAGAGAIRSDGGDLLTLLAAYLGYTKTPLAAAMTTQTAVRHPTGTPGLEVALAWHVLKRDGREIFWHNGATGGYHSFIAFDKKRRTGVVVLTNSTANIDDLGQQLIAKRLE